MYLFSFKGTRKHLKYDFRLTLRYILQKILLRQRVSNFTFSLWIGASPLCIANAGVSEEVRTKMTGHSASTSHQIYTHLELETMKQKLVLQKHRDLGQALASYKLFNGARGRESPLRKKS